MTIYNLFPLLAGRFHEWPPHLQRAAEMGFDWIFLNPIQYSGYSGSLYSVSDYFRWHPLLVDGRRPEDPFLQSRSAIESGEKLGLKFMVDLVINHCAFDSPLLHEHPEWFEWDNGQVVHPFCYDGDEKVVWGDLARFRYHENPALESLIQFWVKVIDFLVEQGFRGFRCDAAYQVPSEVWSVLIAETRSHYPDLVFVAETLGCTPEQTLSLARAGFDFVHNSSKWWDFRSDWLMDQYGLTQGIVDSIGFPESHDTPRLAEELNGAEAGLKQRYFFTALFSGGVMMPMGFEFGFLKALDVVKTRSTDWEEPQCDLRSFISRLNQVRKQSKTFQHDVPTRILFQSNPNVLMMQKHDPVSNDVSLVLLNKDADNYQPVWCENLYRELPVKRPLVDVSPEYPLDYLPTPFEYSLRPGQGIVLVNESAEQGCD